MTVMSARHATDAYMGSLSSSKSSYCLATGAAALGGKASGRWLRRMLSGRAVAGVLALLLMGAMAVPAHAQSVTFSGLQTLVASGGRGNPTFAAVDGAGDVFIVDHGSYQVIEVAPNGTQTTVPTSGLNNPNGIALDKAGDIFVADVGNNRVVEVPYLGNGTYGSQTTIPATGLSHPYGVALDAAGDIFIADTGNKRVVELPYLGNGAYGTQTQVPLSGLADPFGVALDGAGDVFVADFGATSILELPYLGSGNYGTQVSIGSALGGRPIGGPEGVAVDVNGNVFAADTNNNRVVEIPYLGNGSYGAQFTVGSGLNAPTGVAVDGQGDVFIVDNGNDRTVEVQTVAANFGQVKVGENGTLTLTYNISANDNTNVVIYSASVVTQGATGLDFTSLADSCVSIYLASATCSVQVQFAPGAAGLRQGAVQLGTNIGTITTLLRGVGEGPAVAFPGGPQVTVASAASPQGVALDGSGNLFVSEYINGRTFALLEFPAAGGEITIATDFNAPGGLAVDGAGNVFVADGSNNRVVEFPAGCTSSACQITVPTSGLNTTADVFVDGAGNLLIADESNHRIVEETVGCQAPPCQTTLLSQADSYFYPLGVAVDTLGNLFTDDGVQNVFELPSVGTLSTLGTDFEDPAGLRLDAADDVFVADFFHNRVQEIPFGCTSNDCQVTVGSGIGNPIAVATDGAGDVYVADGSNNRVVEVQRSQAPTLSFGSIQVNSTSSPQTVAIQNIGNQPLTFASFAASTNFVVDSGSTTCSTSSPLAVGATCNVGVDFSPTTTGPLTGTLTFTDNALNAASATQNVSLQGTGTPGTYQLTTGANPINGGTVTPSSGPFAANSVVNVTATANAGYVFTGWTGNVANASSASTTVTMTSAQSVTANFVASQLLISQSTLNFGTVYLNNGFHELPITITNVSASTVTISGATIVPGTADAAAYKIVEYCKGQLKPKQKCSLAVDFLADAVGTQTATLNILDNAVGNPQQVSLTANVIDPVAALSPKPLMFGPHPVNSQTTLPVQLTNSGQTDLTVGNITIGGANGGDYSQSNNCLGTLTPTASCTIEVTFTPSAKGGRGATLTVSGNMLTGKTTMSISGTGH